MNTVFTGISHEICERAWGIVLPGIREAADQGVTNKPVGAIVVLDPRVLHHEFVSIDHTLAFAAVVDSGQDSKYMKIARSKALVTFESR